jgi:hypothetical protein
MAFNNGLIYKHFMKTAMQKSPTAAGLLQGQAPIESGGIDQCLKLDHVSKCFGVEDRYFNLTPVRRINEKHSSAEFLLMLDNVHRDGRFFS